MYFAHKDFLFSVVGKYEGDYVAEKEDGYKFKIPIDKDEMAKAYQEMGSINLEEANASVHTYEDGMWLYE